MSNRCRATIVWESGREEVFYGELNRDGKMATEFVKKVSSYRKFPTVKEVRTERIN